MNPSNLERTGAASEPAVVYPEPTSTRIKDLPRSMQPRELVERYGAGRAEDEVLLAVLLRSGFRGKNVRDVARELLVRHGDLRTVARLSLQELTQIKGIGKVKALTLQAAFELGCRLRDQGLDDSPALRSPEEVFAFMKPYASQTAEHFWVLPLNKKNRLIPREPVAVTRGIVDASLVHQREVFAVACKALSNAVILAHNHPSGDPTPSAEDVRITRSMIAAGRVMDIDVLDHVVLGAPGHPAHPSGYFSFRESGLVSFENPA
ncbi:MAG: DNA repair protein RadC [Kiritimatiellae bacterium]|nr:DNA repair protein RadC [Kiritimatiellia bacterium]